MYIIIKLTLLIISLRGLLTYLSLFMNLLDQMRPLNILGQELKTFFY